MGKCQREVFKLTKPTAQGASIVAAVCGVFGWLRDVTRLFLGKPSEKVNETYLSIHPFILSMCSFIHSFVDAVLNFL
jgi:hypothetical protein